MKFTVVTVPDRDSELIAHVAVPKAERPFVIVTNVGGVAFAVTTNSGGNTISWFGSADGGTTWQALNATPSNSTTAATSTTGTGLWQANVAGYTHVCMEISNLVSGSNNVSINPSSASARAGGGGGGAGVTSFTGDGTIITNSASTGAVTATIAGTSGGIPYFNSASGWASSTALGANALVIGGGAGTAPTTGNGDFTYATHTLAGGASGIFDMSAAGANALRTPNVAGTCSAAAGNTGVIEFDTGGFFTGCTSAATYTFAVASTGGGSGTTCVNGQMLRSVNGNGAPGCATGIVATTGVNQTAQTALINTSNLCAATAQLCNVAGQYRIDWNIWGSGTACATPGSGGVTFSLTWTDENSVSHSAVVVPAVSQTSGTAVAVNVSAPTMAFQSTLANESASGSYVLSSSGAAAIQYAVAYVACNTGTGTYNLRASTTRLQ